MHKKILEFWFYNLKPEKWYVKDHALDATIKLKFKELHQQIMRGECASWRNNPESSLAEIIVLDQFSRNMFRDTLLAFSSDSLALSLAQLAIEKEFDQQLEKPMRAFMYLPFMHSESKAVHKEALELYKSLGLPGNLEYEIKHKAIIDRFGRYPHRNLILGRASTEEEIAFLAGPGSSF
jgi:uncharacterized protein (DUF924 family)